MKSSCFNSMFTTLSIAESRNSMIPWWSFFRICGLPHWLIQPFLYSHSELLKWNKIYCLLIYILFQIFLFLIFFFKWTFHWPSPSTLESFWLGITLQYMNYTPSVLYLLWCTSILILIYMKHDRIPYIFTVF